MEPVLPRVSGERFLNMRLWNPHDWRGTHVVFPVTTGLKVESPENVVGFAFSSVRDPEPVWILIEGRDWTGSSQYTGVTADMYEHLRMPEGEAVDLLSCISPFCLSFANNICHHALQSLGLNQTVIPMREMVLFITRGRVEMEAAMAEDREIHVEQKSMKQLCWDIRQTKVPMLSRDALLNYVPPLTEPLRPSQGAGEIALGKDLYIWKALLGTEESQETESDDLPF